MSANKNASLSTGEIIAIVFFIAFVGVLAFTIGGCLSSLSTTSSPVPEESTATPSLVGELELVGGIEGTHWERDGYLLYIVGIIKNNSSHKYNYAQVTFILLDKNNNQVGSAMDNINDLEPGATWKFKALIFDASEVRYYKLGEIVGF